jgi:hypothetical protein
MRSIHSRKAGEACSTEGFFIEKGIYLKISLYENYSNDDCHDASRAYLSNYSMPGLVSMLFLLKECYETGAEAHAVRDLKIGDGHFLETVLRNSRR